MQHISRQTEVPRELAGMRADRAAAELFHEFSRALLSRWIQEGALKVNDAAVKPRHKLLGGETLRLEADLSPREDWQSAEAVPFRVLYEDDHVLVLDKPAGLVVHPGAGNPRGTLVNGLLSYRPALAHLPRAGIVHRLDKDTSGAMLVACSVQAQHALGKMLARHDISRRYLAVVEGVLVGGVDVDKPIGRDPHRRTRQAVRQDGREARTQVRVVDRYRAHSLIEATLETGRTHQIRVHLASIGHVLVGDRRYGARGVLPAGSSAETQAVLRAFPRQALHARYLAFRHPMTDAAVTAEAPVPPDLSHLIDTLEADVRNHAG